MKTYRKKRISVEEAVEGILAGNRYTLSKAITLIESSLPSDVELSQQILERIMPHTGNSIRIGITGVPGVGKSTLIETLGHHIIKQGKKIAVLAVDPSSQKTQGSIMGDKTRMETLAQDINAYIRPSAAGASLGGVARKTRETMLLCEAAGFDVTLIETVGVGQSELAVKGMVDFFLLLMLAGAGDELQGIKKGIMEMADGLAITKAEGDNLKKARLAKGEYKNALHLFRPDESNWSCKVTLCSALEKTGIDKLWGNVEEFVEKTTANGWFEKNRQKQNLQWMKDSIKDELIDSFYHDPKIVAILKDHEQQVALGTMPAYAAAQKLIDIYSKA
ncbi:methylmalonyl Co-A mutase-associated GTPase MeaB [Flammeovirgaceae bacterium SG7u.111]|nr:methylmalonyl Co-A mutase-associated GTPase MeaB [Flammeovirgaceae bacterium SG7u.132]WPO38807.1 methylmalonyl Co-A mutase-associated GTPase MeaB [Flammeovirgaceae bacterium SG7u.111]